MAKTTTKKEAPKTATKEKVTPKVTATKEKTTPPVAAKEKAKPEVEKTPWTDAEEILETAKKLDAKGKLDGETRNTILAPSIERYNAGERSEDLLNQINKLKV